MDILPHTSGSLREAVPTDPAAGALADPPSTTNGCRAWAALATSPSLASP
eukprot:CAMPEP_0118934010 /NCGR_PEP_ID=MMETSP1169-20130426/13325_1 /TAXON_ID=36882 /ORGANISM="Pyramimonas obovata, Strain CCMP722" /LENGTH=49 /DNA_ID= /DNA_START= /DNA_END= /DNA_ORIENTATION=